MYVFFCCCYASRFSFCKKRVKSNTPFLFRFVLQLFEGTSALELGSLNERNLQIKRQKKMNQHNIAQDLNTILISIQRCQIEV